MLSSLIKLCYLQQAIELSADANEISKKKIAEKAVAFHTEAIKPLKVESGKKKAESGVEEAKLLIEIPVLHEESVNYKPMPDETPPEGVLRTNPENTSNLQPSTPPEGVLRTNLKLSALDKIRKQIKGRSSNGNGNGATSTPLQVQELQQAWDEYAAKLKTQKNPAGQNFEMAELRIQDNNSFIALVTNNIQFRFIEHEGLKVSQFLREKLHNNLLQFFIVMEENKEMKTLAVAPMTAREQFLKMTEQYPLVKELKDRLRLELDY